MSSSGYDESWERPHDPSSEHGWQESDCYWFYDRDTGVGGYQRLGLRPNAGVAQIMLLAFKQGGRRYARCDSFTRSVPITGADRWDTGQRAGGHRAEALGDGRMRYTWQEKGSTAELDFSEPFYTPRGWPSGGSGVMSTLNAGGHLEVAGRLRGRITIGEDRYEIDALCHRDRSWGFRDHSTVSFHRYRMSSGTVGRALSWASVTISSHDDTVHSQGFIAREGTTEDVTDARVITLMDADGYTTLGAHTVLTTASGEQLAVPARGVQGFLTALPPTFSTSTIAAVDHDGHRGFQNIEMCPNPGRGGHLPTAREGSLMALENGLSDTTDYHIPGLDHDTITA